MKQTDKTSCRWTWPSITMRPITVAEACQGSKQAKSHRQVDQAAGEAAIPCAHKQRRDPVVLNHGAPRQPMNIHAPSRPGALPRLPGRHCTVVTVFVRIRKIA